MEDPQPTVIDEHAGTNGFPLREEALYAPVAGVPTEPVQPSQPPPPRRRFFPAVSPWPILLAVFLLVGGLGAGYAFSRSNRRHLSGPTPAAAAPNPPPSAPAAPPPPSPTGQAVASRATTPTQVSVPRVVGDSLPRAIAALRHAGLTATVRHVASLKPEGSVIVQNPEAGTKSSKGGSVRLDVSLQPLVAVPDVTGMRGVTAVDTLTRSRLVASIRYVPSSRPARTVVAQYPLAGKKVKRGWEVRINISSGSKEVSVPDVVGEDEATATSDLEAAGFTVDSVDSPTSDPGKDGVVVDQNPSGGTKASDSSTVTIYVGRYSGG